MWNRDFTNLGAAVGEQLKRSLPVVANVLGRFGGVHLADDSDTEALDAVLDVRQIVVDAKR